LQQCSCQRGVYECRIDVALQAMQERYAMTGSEPEMERLQL